ncbi:MAG: PD-(D/E)XK nuclease family protein [Elusimicrobia bacterium]|nr:PD-(D/E)XK nuclease family protein [Elusimicrobiota bacterium]
MEISYSRLKTYRDCPWLFKLLYVDGLYPSLSPAGSLGLSLHRTLERYHARHPEPGDAPDGEAELLDDYVSAWLHRGYQTPQMQVEWFEKGKEILRGYWQMERSRSSKIILVEKEFRFEVRGVWVKGIMDRVDLNADGSYEVVEYKTQKAASSPEEVAGNLQLSLYGLALRRVFGLEPKWQSVLFIREKAKVRAPYNAAGEQALLDLIVEAERKMDQGLYDPDTSHCVRCDFRNRCAYSTAPQSAGDPKTL